MAIQHPTQIIKSQDTIVYVGAVSGVARPTVTTTSTGVTVSGAPTMHYLAGVTNASVAINDAEQEYYLLGNGGFVDSVVTTTRAQASITTYFQKDLDGTNLQSEGVDEALNTILLARNDKDAEVFVEVYKLIGGSFNYDATMFSARVMNYSESYPADNLVEVTFDLMSRGTVGAGAITISGTSKIPTDPNS
jgi:protein subunit release factor A